MIAEAVEEVVSVVVVADKAVAEEEDNPTLFSKRKEITQIKTVEN
jgi:hypothetical protein